MTVWNLTFAIGTMRVKQLVMSKKSEQKYTTYIKKSFKKLNVWFYKIPDSPNQFQFAKPFDAFATLDGISVAIEVKWMDWTGKDSGFSYKMLRASQIEGLSDHSGSKGMSYVMLVLRAARGDIRLYSWDWSEFKTHCGNFKGVIPKKELMNREYIPCKKELFDLSEYVDQVKTDFFYQYLISD